MHFMSEERIFIFLLQITLLWVLARGMGELFRRWRQPTITAEILAGILLGPTILGRLAPGTFAWIFPTDVIQQSMLETMAWFGILLFLLKTGLEMDFSSAWRQRGQAVTISLMDVVLPMVIAFVPTLFLPAEYMGDPGQRGLFALFIATIMTISALPVTARVLQDLNLYKTDLGFLIMGALSLNDIIGWAIFTLVLGVALEGGLNILDVSAVLFYTTVFTVFCLTLGRALSHRIISEIQARKFPEPASSLTLLCLLGSICGMATLRIGIHALFGFFIAGIMAGESRALSEKTRNVIAQMVNAVFIPLFFASIGLKIDFLANFDWFLVVFITVVGIAGRYVGAWVGVTMTSHPRVNRSLISIAHIPGGEMQIVVGILALEYGLIREPVFVAIVFGAIASSVIIGPWMAWAVRRRKAINILEFFSRRAIVPNLRARDKHEAIRELCAVAAEETQMPPVEDLYQAVISREDVIGTAIEEGVAIPHARIADVTTPLIVIGRSREGIDWNSPDGQPTHLVFMIITPQDEDWIQLQVLRHIAVTLKEESNRACLMRQTDVDGLWHCARSMFSVRYISKEKG